MSTIATWWLIVFLGACAVLGLCAERLRVKRKKSRFTGRENLPLEQIYRLYYSDSGLSQNSVLEVWQELAKRLAIAPGLLRPDDRFDNQLAPENGFPTEDELADVEAYMQELAEKSTVSLGNIQTFGDAVRILAHTVR